MSEWKEFKLKDLTTKIGNGATPSGGSNNYKLAGISLIRSQNVLDFQFSLDGLAFIDDEQADALRNVIVYGDDILLNITGDSVARVCKVPKSLLPARVNQHVAIIRVNDKKLNSNFLLYYLQSIKGYLLSISEIGGTRNALTKSMVENLELKIPSLFNQEKIADILTSLDNKIDLLHRQNKTLEALGETLFKQWFIVEADETWDDGKIYHFLSIDYGFPFNSKLFNSTSEGLPLIRIRDIKSNTTDCFTTEKYDNKYIVNTGDLLVGMDGEFRIHIWSGNEALLNQRVCRLNPKDTHISHFFIYALMKPYLNFYEQTKGGTTVIHLGKSDFNEIQIKIPPKEKVLKYSSITTSYYNKLLNNHKQIKTLTKLRDTLLPKLMSGEVRVENEEFKVKT